jgi:mRNA interferase RelE/StbE
VSYQIEISPSAQREVSALSGYVRAQALLLFEALAVDPRPPKAKQLRGKPNTYRIWLAKNWRIVYALEEETITVLILRVRRKEHIDYDSL